MSRDTTKLLEELQTLVIEQLIEELKQGDTTNIGTANSLLSANKIVVKHSEGEGAHSKVKKIMQRKTDK